MRKIALTAALITTLTACTAIQRGEQESFPIQLATPFSPASVLPGQTMFAQVTYPRGVFEDDSELDRYFDAVTFDYSTVRNTGGQVPDAYRAAPWIKLTSVDAPKGISVVLVKAEAGRAVIKSRIVGSSVDVQYYDKVRLTYKINVAADYVPTSAPTDKAEASDTEASSTDLKDGIPGWELTRLNFSVEGKAQDAILAIRTTPEKTGK